MNACWIAVASRDHVRAAVAGGFAQLHHGKRVALDRLKPFDRIVYYSPRERMGDGQPVRAFTAIGEVLDAPVYPGERVGNLQPFRRGVRFFQSQDAPIEALLGELSFTHGRTQWGMMFRRGVFRIGAQDYRVIAAAMKAVE